MPISCNSFVYKGLVLPFATTIRTHWICWPSVLLGLGTAFNVGIIYWRYTTRPRRTGSECSLSITLNYMLCFGFFHGNFGNLDFSVFVFGHFLNLLIFHFSFTIYILHYLRDIVKENREVVCRFLVTPLFTMGYR